MVVASAGWEITICAGWAYAVEATSSSASRQARIFIGLLRGESTAPGGPRATGRLEDDETSPEFPGCQCPKGLVGLLETVALGDELVDLELARLIERDQPRQVLARARAAIARADDGTLTRHERTDVQREGLPGG